MNPGGDLGAWAAAVAADPENAHVGRFSAFTVRLADDAGRHVLLRYEHGRVAVEASATDAEEPADLVLRGPVAAWAELGDPDAAPRRHDLLALTKAEDGLEVVAGREHLLRHLRVLSRLVELGRTDRGRDDG